MTSIFSYPSKTFMWEDTQITLCSWPVVISHDKKILVHISSSTWKYQFIGGRLDVWLSLLENAYSRASEVLERNNIIISEVPPLCLHWEILREDQKEQLILFHFKASLKDESHTWEAVWKTLEELEELWKADMLSSNNILIASKYFLA